MNNFLEILELRTFYIEYKNVKLKAINFSGQTNVKHSSPSYVRNDY